MYEAEKNNLLWAKQQNYDKKDVFLTISNQAKIPFK